MFLVCIASTNDIGICICIYANIRPDSEDISNIRIGTADLLDMFLSEEPNVDFTFTMASDTFISLTDWKWRRSHDVVKMLQGRMFVIMRKFGNSDTEDEANWSEVKVRTYKLNAQRMWEENEKVVEVTEEKNEKNDCGRNKILESPVQIIQIPSLTAVSSTLVRACDDESHVRKLVHPQVVDYILEHKLYALKESG